MPLIPEIDLEVIGNSEHGGINVSELEQLQINVADILDFSTNLLPNTLSGQSLQGIENLDISSYPDPQSTLLRRALAVKNGVLPENIIVGNGSTEIIRLAVTAYCGNKGKPLIIGPTYGEYYIACNICGSTIITQQLTSRNNFTLNTEDTTLLIKNNRPQIIFLCNPNNPTGSYLPRPQFQTILDAAPESLIILDEAYIDFVRHPWDAKSYINRGNLLILRSLTKNYSLAGLRLGYAIGSSSIISVLQSICPPWNVNVVAQYAGIQALQNEEIFRKSRTLAFQGKRYLISKLEGLGYRCLPSATHYFLVEVHNASQFRTRLLQQGILVRDGTSFGLPEYIRVAPKMPWQNRRLISAIRNLKKVEHKENEC